MEQDEKKYVNGKNHRQIGEKSNLLLFINQEKKIVMPRTDIFQCYGL